MRKLLARFWPSKAKRYGTVVADHFGSLVGEDLTGTVVEVLKFKRGFVQVRIPNTEPWVTDKVWLFVDEVAYDAA